MARLQVIGDEVFYDGVKVAELTPYIPTSPHIAFRDFLTDHEYTMDEDNETADTFLHGMRRA